MKSSASVKTIFIARGSDSLRSPEVAGLALGDLEAPPMAAASARQLPLVLFFPLKMRYNPTGGRGRCAQCLLGIEVTRIVHRSLPANLRKFSAATERAQVEIVAQYFSEGEFRDDIARCISR